MPHWLHEGDKLSWFLFVSSVVLHLYLFNYVDYDDDHHDDDDDDDEEEEDHNSDDDHHQHHHIVPVKSEAVLGGATRKPSKCWDLQCLN